MKKSYKSTTYDCVEMCRFRVDMCRYVSNCIDMCRFVSICVDQKSYINHTLTGPLRPQKSGLSAPGIFQLAQTPLRIGRRAWLLVLGSDAATFLVQGCSVLVQRSFFALPKFFTGRKCVAKYRVQASRFLERVPQI